MYNSPESLSLGNNIDKKIEDKFNDPNFIRQVANKIRLPFIVFDENNKYIIELGGEEYIESIKINKNEKKEINDIIVNSKMFLNTPPILQNIGGQMQFYEPQRIGQKGWQFKAFSFDYVVSDYSGTPPPLIFKLDIIPILGSGQ